MTGRQLFGGLYEGIVSLKNFLYDKEYFQSLELPIPVLSIGNLTVGGTGKTPLTDFCLKYYQNRGIKVAVVSRNYRAEVKSIAKVDPTRERAAAYFGDEPVLLAQRNPQSSFFVGPLKYQTARYALDKESPQVIILDDGFQHRKLYRDIDLVILDATEPGENYRCLPVGRAREPFDSLSRATAILISKTNLVAAEDLNRLTADLKKDFDKPVFCFTYELINLWSSSQEKSLQSCAGMKTMLISGIAKPQTFEKSLADFSLDIVRHCVFADHHNYTARDVKKILADWKNAGEPLLITTEKDQVKLKNFWPTDIPLWVAPLEVRLSSQEDLFYEILDQVLH